MNIRRLLLGVALLGLGAPLGAQESEVSGTADPAHEAAPRAEARVVRSWFPSGTLFPALSADLKEPRNYASFRRTRFAGEALPTIQDNGSITAALLGLGTEFGIWGWRDAANHGLQLGLTAGVFTQFDMSSSSPTMLNADYIVGPQLTYRRGDVGVRTRVIHQSSHLGDGLLRRATEMNVEVGQRGPSLEWVDALGFIDGRHVRLYGTTRYVLQSITRLAPWQAAGGAELRGRARRWGALDAQPFAGFHVEVLEARAWGSSRSAVAGISFHRPGQPRGLRISGVYQNGFTPFGKFFTTVRVRSYGIQLEFVQ